MPTPPLVLEEQPDGSITAELYGVVLCPELLKRVRSGETSARKMALELGIKKHQGEHLRRKLKAFWDASEPGVAAYFDDDDGELTPVREWKQSGDMASLRFVTSKPISEETLCAAANVDPSKWQIKDFDVSAFDGQQKNDKTGETTIVRMHRARARFQRVYSIDAVQEVLRDLAAEIRPYEPSGKAWKAYPDARMLMLSFPDVHFGKAAAGWSIDDAEKLFRGACDYFIGMATARHPLALTVIPIGNDVTHIDNALGTTTSGTRVESIASWQRQFKAACRSYVYKITQAREHGPVRVVLVQGNHGWNTDFAIEQYLTAFFRNDEGVVFGRAFCDEYGHFGRQYVEWGKNLLGFVHKPAKGEKLTAAMAHEAPKAWARTAGGWREWHVAHHHHRELSKPGAYIEIDGVVIRMNPALCDMDMFHRVGMWFSMRGAEAHLYEKEGGHIGMFSLPQTFFAEAA